MEGHGFRAGRRGGRIDSERPQHHAGLLEKTRGDGGVLHEIDGGNGSGPATWPGWTKKEYFHFFDRKRDLIKHKGYSVFARHVEEVLYKHPQIKAAGVVGVPDPKVGNVIKAYVVLQSEARGKISEEEIIEFCRKNLAHYKVPQDRGIQGELPKTDVGKVSRRELREEAEGR